MRTTVRIVVKHCFLYIGVLLCLATFQSLWAQARLNGPIKLSINRLSKAAIQGETFEAECVLLDALNQRAPTSKDLVGEIDAVLPSGKTNVIPMTIKAGQTSWKFTIPLHETGLTKLRAQQAEVIDGSSYIRVRPVVPRTLAPLPKVPTPPQHPSSTTLQPRVQSTARFLMTDQGNTAKITSQPLETIPSPTPKWSGVSQPIGVILLPEVRTFLADGVDTAAISAYLDDTLDVAPTDIHLELHNESGHLVPIPLVIAKGQDFGEARLSSTEARTVHIKAIQNPKVNVKTNSEMDVRFSPAITQLGLSAGPSSISLLEDSTLTLSLFDKQNITTETDVSRQIVLTIESGGGEFQSGNPITISPGSASVIAKFLPLRTGTTVISAASPHLARIQTQIVVTMPTLLITYSLIGGLLGGTLASLVLPNRRKHRLGWLVRIFVGIITGFVFYYFGVLGITPHITRAIALNPFGALVLSILGGWTGTEVFTPLLKIVGVGKPHADNG
jgi:uncharacterized membrane protein YeaQ/YmgE (transglycosylase-associated protein family)